MFCVIRSMLSRRDCASLFLERRFKTSSLALSSALTRLETSSPITLSSSSRISSSSASFKNFSFSAFFCCSSCVICAFISSSLLDQPESSVSIRTILTLWFSMLFLIIAFSFSIWAASASSFARFSRIPSISLSVSRSEV